MSYPRTVKLFVPWSKAMVEGATVDKPDYGKKMTSSKRARSKRRKRRRKKRHNGSKD